MSIAISIASVRFGLICSLKLVRGMTVLLEIRARVEKKIGLDLDNSLLFRESYAVAKVEFAQYHIFKLYATYIFMTSIVTKCILN